MTWYSLITGRQSSEGPQFGVEIEIEGRNLRKGLHTPPREFWQIENDGSLRNGMEFKFRQPQNFSESLSRVQEYEDFLSSTTSVASPRTSVHIHVNVQDLTNEQLKSFIWLSVAMEPVILRFCTELRNHNGYCIPVHKSRNLVKMWREFFAAIDKNNIRYITEAVAQMPKYAAVGGYRLRDLGTIEFRMFPGCTYAPKITWYLQILRSIYETAQQYTVKQLQDKKIADGVLSLISDVILTNRKRVSLKSLNESIEVGITMANDIARSPMTWEEVRTMRKEMFPSKFQPWTTEALLAVCHSDNPKEALKRYDPEEYKEAMSNGYNLFMELVKAGLDHGKAHDLAMKVRGVLL